MKGPEWTGGNNLGLPCTGSDDWDPDEPDIGIQKSPLWPYLDAAWMQDRATRPD